MTNTGSPTVLGAGAGRGWGLSERVLKVYLYFSPWLTSVRFLDDFYPGGQERP